jgi:nucleotide-binding universal stress UspA family protein/quercetin dioxygenase-like cupin family protein
MPRIDTILHPTDFSENSRYAFETACALARDNRASLLVLHVMMPAVSPLLDRLPPDPLRSVESQQSVAQLPWPQSSDPHIRVEHRLTEGDSASEILRLIEALHCDLVVMGTHGRSGLSRLLTGSVAEEVLRNATCPVLVVKAPPRPTPGTQTETTARPGEPVDVRPLGNALASAHARRLVQTPALELVRLIVRAGREIPAHKSRGEIIVHCLEGRVALNALGTTQELSAGTLVQLPAGEAHSLTGIEDASLLLTILKANAAQAFQPDVG